MISLRPIRLINKPKTQIASSIWVQNATMTIDTGPMLILNNFNIISLFRDKHNFLQKSQFYRGRSQSLAKTSVIFKKPMTNSFLT
jgi:hypothetical protein